MYRLLNFFSPYPHHSLYRTSHARNLALSLLRPFLLIAAILVCLSLTLPANALEKKSTANSKHVHSGSKRPHKKAKSSAKSTAKSASKESTEPAHFERWTEVNEFIDKMANQYGFERQQLRDTFAQVRYQESALKLIRPAPAGKPKNWKAYRARFVESGRIEAGLAFWDQYGATLEQAEQQYGVPAEIIVGLIGVETYFGRTTGAFRVIDALTTLAFAYPDIPNKEARMRFFQSELESFLLLTHESSIDPFSYKGSYAGAFGLAQFMPSSLRRYAVDFDHDGQINLLTSPADAIGSVAHYLAQHGWKRGLPTVFPATLTNTAPAGSEEEQKFNEQLNQLLRQGLRASYQLAQIKPIANTASTDAPGQILYGLIDLQNGDEPTEYWLATENFFAITQYNRSYFYAMSVIDLGRVIASSRTK